MHAYFGLSQRFLFVLGGLLVFAGCKEKDDQPAPEGIFINEVYASGDDWIELYNDLESVKDISGYTIYDDAINKYKLPAGTVIPAKGFLLLYCNDLATGLNTSFKLSSGGEIIYLENQLNELIDKVEYSPLQDGQSFGRYPDGSAFMAVSGKITKGTSNGDTNAPAIADVSRLPLVVRPGEAAKITVSLVSINKIKTVSLSYRLNGAAFTTVNMSQVGNLFEATIPASNSNGTIEYYVQATGTNELSGYAPDGAPIITYKYVLSNDVIPTLVINEFMAANTSCCADKTTGTDEFDDWIEIYNAGGTAVNLAGMYLSDDKTNPFKYKIPETNASLTTIPAKGWLLIWADGSPSQGLLHADFSLTSTGEEVGLFYKDGRTIDSYTFGVQTENVSFGRTTDGAATWKSFPIPTPGKAN